MFVRWRRIIPFGDNDGRIINGLAYFPHAGVRIKKSSASGPFQAGH